MSAFTTFILSRNYFLTNWDTFSSGIPLQVPEQSFDNSNIDEYIDFRFINNGSTMVGTASADTTHSYIQIHCYNKDEILSVKLSDMVKIFFDNRHDIGSDIHSKDGQSYPTVKLENSFFLSQNRRNTAEN